MTYALMFTPEAVAGYADTALFTIINLLVTYYVLNRFLFKPILKVLRKRREDVANELADADRKLKDAESKLNSATIRLEESAHEAATMIANARSQAEVQGEAILSGAKQEASGMLSRADAEIGRMRVAMINGVRDEVADLSVAIASKVIGKAMDERHQRDLVEQFLDQEMTANQAEASSVAPAAGPAAGLSGLAGGKSGVTAGG